MMREISTCNNLNYLSLPVWDKRKVHIVESVDAIGPTNHSNNEEETSDSQETREYCQPARAGEYSDQVNCWG